MAYGASSEDRKAFNEMMKDPANKKCVDCDAPNPQWANIHHGVFICLECAGAHRGLGVHLSFVRSITMDKWLDWKPEKLKQMQIGGNKKALDWFAAKGVPGGFTREDIKARYNHNGALMYKEKLEHELEGKPWSEANFVPPPQPTRSPIPAGQGGRGGGYSGSRMQGMGSSPMPQKKGGDKDILDDVSKGFSKMGTAIWAGATAVGDSVKKGSEKAAHSARSIDTGTMKESASKTATDAGKAVQAGWGWFSSNIQKAAASAQQALGGNNEEGGSKSKDPTGPVGAEGEYLAGETVIWTPMTGGPTRAVVSAVDDRTDPPTYILRLEDGGKRGCAHKQLQKYAAWVAAQEGTRDDNDAIPSTAASQGSPTPSTPVEHSPAQRQASPANYGGTHSPTPAAASPTVNRPSLKPAAKKAAPPPKKNDEDDWSDWD